MNQLARSTAVFLISTPTVQALIDCGLYRVCGKESIVASCIRAAEALAAEFESKKPSGLTGKLASEFFACSAGRVLLSATDADFARMAESALVRAAEIEEQLNSKEDEPVVAAEVAAATTEQSEAEAPAAEQSPGAVVAPTPAASQVEAATTDAQPTTEAAAPTEAAAKPADVPVEDLAQQGIPTKVIEVLVAAGLATAKAVRERDAQSQITDLTDIGPAIRKKILAAIDELIA